MVLNHAGTTVTINAGQKLRVRTGGNDYEYSAGDSRTLHPAIAKNLIDSGVAS